MKITKETENGKITLKLDGWLDAVSSPELGAEIEKIEAAEEIVIDFDKVEYIASSGLRQVVAAHQRAKEVGAVLSVINACTEVMSIFKLTGLDKKLKITEK